MTWLEKFHAEHPKLAESYIVEFYCPEDQLVNMNCAMDNDPNTDTKEYCKACWARQVPEETTEGPDRT